MRFVCPSAARTLPGCVGSEIFALPLSVVPAGIVTETSKVTCSPIVACAAVLPVSTTELVFFFSNVTFSVLSVASDFAAGMFASLSSVGSMFSAGM